MYKIPSRFCPFNGADVGIVSERWSGGFEKINIFTVPFCT